MLLTVKLLLGRRCSLQVSGKESVATLKKLVSQHLQVPEAQQHLLFRGQLLDDNKHLSDYSIGPNASINVIMRPPEEAALDKTHQPQPLWLQLDQVLGKHFGPKDAKAVLGLLRQEHEERLQRLNLEALEQLVGKLLEEQKLEELAEEKEESAVTSELQQNEEGGGGGEEVKEEKDEEEADQQTSPSYSFAH
ncbi:ubiquitin-like protein 4B [Cricetulus griseus]|uniref:Ubiquitin-like protein 4B n=2 Tax=Cricetulus griseus TaxID=10029 RepID=G3IG29_CRIGR|nr:ubiquitin-like protein 4B [Cricetulus griseus]XP_027251762.1 ubiquitin-like protein 4B [Cricetulus griseus]EGW10895.1 Ubiquitin-like protein 4B [Cricetulus griseus]ERE91050.1 ubiquitin-like protein 4B-like protein [Cricetulus griseus]